MDGGMMNTAIDLLLVGVAFGGFGLLLCLSGILVDWIAVQVNEKEK